MIQNLCNLWFDKTDGFIEIYDGTRYLALVGLEKYKAIYNRIRYLMIRNQASYTIFVAILQKSKLILIILCQ